MKKAISIVLAILIALSLFSCAKSTSGDDASPAPSASTAPSASETPDEPAAASPGASAEPGASVQPVKTGFFDPDRDYTKNQTYKVVYMMNMSGVLYQAFSDAFAIWASRMNIDYSDYISNGDNDGYLNNIEIFKEQGVHGLLMDPDATIWPRIVEVCDEVGIPFMGCMGRVRDAEGVLAHPSVGADQQVFGNTMGTWLIEYAKETWADFDPKTTAMLALDYSVNPDLHLRSTSAQDVWTAAYPDLKDNILVADMVSGKLDADTAYNMSSAIMSSNPQFTHWLVVTLFDDTADACARAAEQLGKDEKTAVITCGGTGLIDHWDLGEESCWRAAVFTAQILFAEPIICGLYAMMEGKATPETLWPEWINNKAGDKYATLKNVSYTLTKDTYQEYMGWVASYAGIESKYQYNGTQYQARLTVVPDYYNN